MARESPAIFRERDVLLVCDVGGGTTDLSALRVTGTGSGSLSLEQLDVVFGANLGSAQIDRGFETATAARLELANGSLPLGIETEDAAWEMMKSREYQNAKCDYGAPDDTHMFSVAIPKLNKAYTNEPAGIVNGEMRFQRDELKVLFDAQIGKLYELIDKQIARMQQKLPTEQLVSQIAYLDFKNSCLTKLGASRSLRRSRELRIRPAKVTRKICMRCRAFPQCCEFASPDSSRSAARRLQRHRGRSHAKTEKRKVCTWMAVLSLLLRDNLQSFVQSSKPNAS